MNTVSNTAEEYFESKKRTFKGEGDFINKEDFLAYASQFKEQDTEIKPEVGNAKEYYNLGETTTETAASTAPAADDLPF